MGPATSPSRGKNSFGEKVEAYTCDGTATLIIFPEENISLSLGRQKQDCAFLGVMNLVSTCQILA